MKYVINKQIKENMKKMKGRTCNDHVYSIIYIYIKYIYIQMTQIIFMTPIFYAELYHLNYKCTRVRL